MKYEIWWVDSWLMNSQEPHASAVKLEDAAGQDAGLRLLHNTWLQWKAGRFGRGQLVLLDDSGRCVGGPVPVKRRKACTVPRLRLADVRAA